MPEEWLTIIYNFKLHHEKARRNRRAETVIITKEDQYR